MGGNFKFQVQDRFLEYFFWRFGDLKNESHFLKKKPPLQLCSLHENYNKGVVSTGWDNFKLPQTVASSITLIDVAEFNENENTITLQMILSIRWYSTTMTLESNQDKYVSNQLHLKYVI